MESGYQEARTAAAFHPRTTLGRVRLTGADAPAFLHALVTNDVTSLPPGSGCYAALLTPQGRMITDMEVLRTDAGVLLAVPATIAGGLAVRLDRSLFTEDATVTDVSGETVQFGVIGPQARASVDAALAALGHDAATASLARAYDNVSFADGSEIVWRAEPLDGLDVFTIVVPAAKGEEIRAALAERCARLSEATYRTLRVEAGRPEFLVDMTEDTIPLEANLLDRAISTSKGCYVGQEVIIRVLHRGGGRVAKRLVSLRLDGESVADAGTALFDGEREIGRVTSAVWSPRDAAAIALGYVHRDYARVGAAFTLADGRAAVVTSA